MFVTKKRVRLDYCWVMILAPSLFGLSQILLASLFEAEADTFLAGIFFITAVILIASSILYFLRLKLTAYLGLFVVVLSFLALYFNYTGELFEFTGSDSSMYYSETQKRLGRSLGDALTNFVNTTKYGWDDAGMIVYSHIIFTIFNSIVFQRSINFILLILQATLLSATLKKLAVQKDVINLTLGLYVSNSAILYFVSSGLKETLFTTLVVFVWYFYFTKRNALSRIVGLILSTGMLYLFRIPELLLTLMSLLSRQYRKGILIMLVPVCGVLSFVLFAYQDVIFWYMARGEQDVDVARNMGTIYKVSVYSSAVFGPFSTFIPVEDQRDTLMYSMGLTTIMVMRLYMVLSVKYLFKKFKKILPILVHIGLHMIVLLVVDRTLKIRYWMPALPAMYISFAYVLQISERRGQVSLRILFAVVVSIVWLIFWNILRYN